MIPKMSTKKSARKPNLWRREVGSSVFQVFDGTGRVSVGDHPWDVNRGDLFVRTGQTNEAGGEGRDILFHGIWGIAPRIDRDEDRHDAIRLRTQAIQRVRHLVERGRADIRAECEPEKYQHVSAAPGLFRYRAVVLIHQIEWAADRYDAIWTLGEPNEGTDTDHEERRQRARQAEQQRATWRGSGRHDGVWVGGHDGRK